MIDNNLLQNTIENLFENTDSNIHSVSCGYKIKNGKRTNTPSIIFKVYQKLPLNVIPKDQILPSSISVGGQNIPTDVVSQDSFIPLNSKCYSVLDSTSKDNRLSYIPNLLGGISIGPTSVIQAGTLGGIFLDYEDNSFIGLTNNHVVITEPNNIFINSEKPSVYAWDIRDEGICQPARNELPGYTNWTDVGKIKRYYPFTLNGYNRIDAAIIGFNASGVIEDLLKSKSQLNLSLPSTFFDFATSEEIDNLLGNNTIRKSSRSTGSNNNNSICKAVVTETNVTTFLNHFGYQFKFTNCISIEYQNQISLKHPDTGRAYSVSRENIGYPGDSGSVVLANIMDTSTGLSTIKVIGLLFAVSSNIYGPLTKNGTPWIPKQYNNGLICRIDQIASFLNIGPLSVDSIYINDPQNWTFITKPGPKEELDIIVDSKRYWQVGSDVSNNSIYVNYGSNIETPTVVTETTPTPNTPPPLDDCCFSSNIHIIKIDENCSDQYVCVIPTNNTGIEKTTIGLCGWDVDNGRVASFGNVMGFEDVKDTKYKQLLHNTVKWLTKEKSNPKILLLNDDGQPSWSTPRPDYIITLKNILEQIGDVDISSQSWFNFDGSELPQDYDLIIPGGSYNWHKGGAMPNNGQQSIVDFVSNGGALLTQEWLYWRAAVSPSSFSILTPILPADAVSPWTKIIKLSWLKVNNNAIISNGIPDVYTWPAADVDGSITFIETVKSGATIFYNFIASTFDTSNKQCIDIETYNDNKNDYIFMGGPYNTDYCDWKCGEFPTTTTPVTETPTAETPTPTIETPTPS